ncbi:hypothetical protein J2R99_000645 [Rhodopseudomonas julia]|uniref:Transposase n=1 Tax=Rhodopseudomonas julia TaxID=200617 RepID=A0ABU0C2R1_9BRAD|nr:hypothetical protein [Rhodopseudomonas julia]MDQ0324796.1 hypothetical protein [Rhodopseudomonas julia]
MTADLVTPGLAKPGLVTNKKGSMQNEISEHKLMSEQRIGFVGMAAEYHEKRCERSQNARDQQ